MKCSTRPKPSWPVRCNAPGKSPPSRPIAIWGTKQAVNYAAEHSVEDSLRQMGWLQGAIWSNATVREAVTAMKQKRVGSFKGLAPLVSFNDID